MRTLQRTRQRVAARPELVESRQPLGPTVRRFERRLLLARLRWLALTILLPVALIFGVHWFWNLRVVVSGTVTSNTITCRAPAAVRVVEVYCQDGQHVKRGTPLLRLEARDGRDQRRTLEYLVEQRRLRLKLAEAGSDLSATDLPRRAELLATARDEFTVADGDYRVAVADLDRIWKERSVLLVTLRQELEQQEGDMHTLSEQADSARMEAESAEAEDKFTASDIAASQGLMKEGLLSSQAFARKEADYLAARREWEALDAAVRSVESQLDTLRNINDLERRRSSYRLQELDARVEAQKRRIQAAWERRSLWEEVLEQYEKRGLGTSEEELRDLELLMFRAELREAEAKLDNHDHTAGNRIVRAESDGVIDRVHVAAGNVVDQDAELVSYFDPWTQWCTAYLPPSAVGKVIAGQDCQVVAEGTQESLTGRITSLGRRWVPTPDALLHPGQEPELLLPIRIDLEESAQRLSLRPDTPLRVFIAPQRPGRAAADDAP